LRTRICSHFQVPAPIAARIQRTQVPFPGQAHAIGRQGRQAGFVECEAGAYQLATASLTRDVVFRRWALDEQLTEDADGAGRQLKVAHNLFIPSLAWFYCVRDTTMGSLRCPTNRQSAASKVADVHPNRVMHSPHKAEGTFPGLGESLVRERAARGVVSRKSRKRWTTPRR